MKIFINHEAFDMETNYYDFSVEHRVPIQLLRMVPILSFYGNIHCFVDDKGENKIGLFLGRCGNYSNKYLLASPSTYISINSKNEKYINCVYSVVESWKKDDKGNSITSAKYHKRLKVYEAEFAGFYCLVDGIRCYGPNSALREKPTLLIPIRREN